ncbi:helix-hairpin-helix domain-containing protein [Mycoplasmopsis cynos]|uniref:helix-hairpin-helix domain-containing protein n=1 Tax=Mycoplasmopsis cynos TaxID=171284 RepID=UPI002AFE6474|nr:Tex-like N-terminal domain-containing protein [Mycoplasmopsis cynos]WQQ17416.1 Tex-like N-terminal domain-containing protein [Mycoplasmopsis cynos]
MFEKKLNINIEAIKKTSNELDISVGQVKTVLNMLYEGDTVPFIARYRQNETYGLNEEQIYQIDKLFKYYEELEKKKNVIIETLKEKGLLTDELLKKINATKIKSELEAIYEPFKVGKITKATEAIKLGLEPLAKLIFNNKNPKFDINKEAQKFLTDKVTSIEVAIQQANYIIAQWISQDIEIREEIKKRILLQGLIYTKFKKTAKDEKAKFRNYYDYKIPIKYIKNHNVLAINRAVELEVISLGFEYKFENFVSFILYKIDRKKINENNFKAPIIDALKRLILPSVEREIFNDLFARAEKSAIEIFSNSVEKLLNSPAIDNVNILAIDPGFKNGCKLAVLNKNGDVLEIGKIFPHEPLLCVSDANKYTLNLIKKHNIDIIVIGNGTASRETEYFISNLIKSKNLNNVKYTIVSEVGASVYSASKVALEEFPDLSVEEKSAINIGRKFLDPLNEYVKIDPKSIGVGQYQHDVNQKELQNYLTFKVQKVVNEIGVDINTATKSILTYVSGLSEKLAEKIVQYRRENGDFKDRKDIKNVKGLGAKTYEQAIGFLRIFNTSKYLDKTFIHPDSYELALKVINDYKLQPSDQGIDVSFLDANELVSKYNSNIYDINLILNALSKPVKRIKKDKSGFILKSSVTNFNDLKVGLNVVGTIENITDFGLFVYIGMKENLFIHINNLNIDLKLKSQFDEFFPGQTIEAIITEIDIERHRLSGKIA